MALRFDLTVPFARFAAQHIGKLGTPFKRYHMGPVWRGENTAARPLPRVLAVRLRHHRHRPSNAADIETALVIHDLMRALGFERLRDPRQQPAGAERPARGDWAWPGKAAPLLRALDKLPKIGRDAVHARR